MGMQDREWYRDHHRNGDAARRATYTPRAFRRDSKSPASAFDRPKGTGRSRLAIVTIWLAIGVACFAGWTAYLKHRGKPVVPDNVMPAGIAAGRLRITCEPASTAVLVELLQLGASTAPTGMVWRISVKPGTTVDRDVPEGRYRVRVTRARGLSSTADELPNVIEFHNSGGQTAGGTLRI